MASEFYLEIVTKQGGKIKGESTSSVCPNQIEVKKFSLGLTSKKGSDDDSGSSTPAARVELEEADFEFSSSAATAPLVQAICTNDQIKQATLSCVKTVANGTAAIYMQWRFNDARFTSVQCDGDEQNEPGEKIKIVYSGLEVQYKQQKQDGSFGAGMMAAYSSSDNAMTSPTLK